MDDTLCGKFDFLRVYLPDELSKTGTLELKEHSSLKNYCPITGSGENECDNDLGKITAGFLWLLEQCYSALKHKTHDINSINAFYIYITAWFSYQLNQIKGNEFTTINEYYTKNVKTSGKYERFINDAYKFTDFKEFIDKQNYLMDINIEDLYKFYDASKLLCNMYINVAKNQKGDILSNNANDFVKKYIELYNKYNNGAPHNQILSALSTDYNNLKDKCTNCSSLPEIETSISALRSGDTSSSSIGNKLFTVLSIFGAIAFFLGISYKYSLFGFRKRAQKQYLREKIKKIKKKMNQ
ncbi:hypothetical protein YYC_05838 [Plasmodium yoelii 17X]|uniref:YIR protein n=1 Tax=Plasmodium yoelii 17X TaxID=1323249 RepID=V7P9D4_PLAYE|nr:hypothetical protein YYC_05838 [Plasmodium yoelii 17X]